MKNDAMRDELPSTWNHGTECLLLNNLSVYIRIGKVLIKCEVICEKEGGQQNAQKTNGLTDLVASPFNSLSRHICTYAKRKGDVPYSILICATLKKSMPSFSQTLLSSSFDLYICGPKPENTSPAPDTYTPPSRAHTLLSRQAKCCYVLVDVLFCTTIAAMDTSRIDLLEPVQLAL